MRLSHLFDALVCRLYLSRRPAEKCVSQTNRILVITYDAIGDMVMTTPVLECLKKVFPDSEMDILCSPRNADIIRYCDYISELFALNLNSGKSFAEWRTLSLLRKKSYARIINLFDEAGDLALAKISSLSNKIYSLPIVYKNQRQQRILSYVDKYFKFSWENKANSFTERMFCILNLFEQNIPDVFEYKICIPSQVKSNAVKRLGLSQGNGIVFNPDGSRKDNSLSESMIINILTTLLKQYERVIVFPYGLMGQVLNKNTELSKNKRLAIIDTENIIDVVITVEYAAEVLTTDTALAHFAIACERPVTIIKARSDEVLIFDPPYGDFEIVPAKVKGFLGAFDMNDVMNKLRLNKPEAKGGPK